MSSIDVGRLDVLQDNLNLTPVLRGCLACAVIAVDVQKRIRAFNPEAEDLTGIKANDLLDNSFELLPAALQSVISETFSSGQPICDRSVALQTPDCGARDLRVSTTLTQPGREGTPAVIAVVHDLTSARQLEPDLRRLDRLAMLGTLSASLSHEIRNALVAGKTFIDLLLEKHQDAELAEIVRREMGRIDSIVAQMLKFAGPAKPAISAVRLHGVLDHSLRLVQPQMQIKTIALSRSFQAAPDLVEADDYQLEQAFVNLFLNALDAMGPHGTLTVATETVSTKAGPATTGTPAATKQIRVTIKDTGAGIAPENAGRLFEPFFTTKQDGTGLGLAITRRIIREHRGEITLESQPGQGATFSIVLPALEETH